MFLHNKPLDTGREKMISAISVIFVESFGIYIYIIIFLTRSRLFLIVLRKKPNELI